MTEKFQITEEQARIILSLVCIDATKLKDVGI